MQLIDDELYIGGLFSNEVVGTRSQGMLTWNGVQWGVVPDGIKASVSTVQKFQDKLYVAGKFGGNNNQIAIW